MPKATICIWFDGDAEAAASSYPATLPDSQVAAVHHGLLTTRPQRLETF